MRDDRRTSARIPFSCRAQLMLMGHSVLSCRVADLCSSGFYLTQILELPRLLADPLNPVKVGVELEVVVMPSDSTDRPLRFRTRVTRIENGSLGVELIAPGHIDVLTLLEMAKDPHEPDGASASIPQKQPSLSTRTSLIDKLAVTWSYTLDQILEQFFELATDKLLALASHSSSNTVQTQHFDLIGELKNRRELLAQQFKRPLIEGWAVFANREVEVKAVKQARSENDLSVVDKDEFEDWLTINVMVTNAEVQYRQQIEWLQSRLSVLAGRDIDRAHNPLGPDYIYGCLQDAVEMLNATPQLLQQLYKIFETAALPKLGELYSIFNAQMKAADILPDIEKRRKRIKLPSARPSASQASAEVPVEARDNAEREAPESDRRAVADAATAHPAPQGAPLKAVQDLLAWRRSTALKGDGDRSAAPLEGSGSNGSKESNWSQVELMAALTVMQGQLQNQPEMAVDSDLRSVLSGVLRPNGQNARQFSGMQQDCIDIVDSLFDVLMEKQSIPDKVKPWLRTQQVPLLKVLVQDQTFFSNAEHPARQVLNKMAKLASAPSGAVESMQRTLHGFCDRILEEYDRDPTVYEDVHSELSKLEHRQDQAITRNTQRLVRTCDGQQRLQQAKKIVGCEIDLRIGGRRVPPVIIDLLDIGLRDIMVLTYVREGVNSESWSDLWQLVDQLFDWLGVGDRPEVGAELERSLEADALLEMIARYLDTPAVALYQRDEVMDSLRSLLIQDSSEVDRSDWVTVPVISELRDDSGQPINVESELHRWKQRAKRLQVGDWLAQINRADHQDDIKLAWIGDGFSSFVFVNQQGLKAVEYDLDELAQAMSEGLLPSENLPEESLLDKGMFNIVQNVYRDMAYQTSHDQLTGLLSRKAFEKQLRSLVAQADSHSSTRSLCYIDVDFFKAVNTTCGMEAGDQLLQEIALVLGECEFPVLACARVGGNEFAFVLEDSDLDEAIKSAEQLRLMVESMDFVWGEKKIPQTVSIGVAEINNAIESSGELIKHVTSACQEAKDEGRNRVAAFQYESEFESQKDEMEVLAFIQRALDDQLLQLRCQRIQDLVDVSTRNHYEVLLCLREEDDLSVPLETFITIAEKHNRMPAIDRWVISSLFEWIAAHPRQSGIMGSYSINLSGNSLNDNQLMDFILEQFSRTGVSPEIICFEVTETATIANIAKTADFIREMKKIGCRFSLDDFGTGLSSFAYLKQLPVDYLKIDGVFIKEIAQSPVDYAMVKSIKEVGHFMGMRVIAEYVENEDIIHCLREIGIDYAQGYAVEKPELLTHYQQYFSAPVTTP